MERELPEGWIEVTIEDCSVILDNLRQPVNSDERAKRIGSIPYYGATGQAGWIDDYLFDEELVLLGEDGAPFFDKLKDVAFIIEGKSWVNNHAHVLKAVEGVTSNKFLLYYLNYIDYTNYVSGTTRLKLTQGSLKEIPVLLPPLAEQKRIVAKLDEAFQHLDTLKAKLERIPVLLKNFRQSVLTQAVTGKLTEEWREENGIDSSSWRERKIGDLIHSIEAGKNFNCPSEPVTKDTVGLVKISAVTWGKFYSNETKTVVNPEFIFPKLFIQKGDFLFSRANTLELVGASVIVDEIEYKIMLSDKVWRVNFKDNITKIYINYFLKSREGRNEIENRASGNQLSMRNISQDKFKDIDLNLPSLPEQEIIVSLVDALFAKADGIEGYSTTLKEKIERLPQAFLAKAFRAELVPQDPNEEPASVLLEKIKGAKAAAAKPAKGKKVRGGKQAELAL